jgi:hypothetical protein
MRFSKLAFALLMLGLALPQIDAQAQQIGSGDFGSGKTVVTYDNLGLPFNNLTPIVIDGDTYRTDDATLRYVNNFGTLMGLSGGGIGSNTELGFIDITLGTAANRVGGNVGVLSDWTSTVTFYDAANVLLGTVNVAGTGSTNAGTNAFAGFQSLVDPIARVRITDTANNGFVILFKNLTTESVTAAVPEPGSVAFFVGMGLSGAGFLARRRKNARKAA